MASGADKKIGKCQGYESEFRTFVLFMEECYFHGEANKYFNLKEECNMAKVKLPRGIRENKGTYEARAMVNGVKICLYSSDLDQLKEEFEQAKQQARNNLDYKRTQMNLKRMV